MGDKEAFYSCLAASNGHKRHGYIFGHLWAGLTERVIRGMVDLLFMGSKQWPNGVLISKHDALFSSISVDSFTKGQNVSLYENQMILKLWGVP